MSRGHPRRSGRTGAAAAVAAAVFLVLALGAPPPTVAEAGGRFNMVVHQTVEPPLPQQHQATHPFTMVITRYPSSERAALASAPASAASTDAALPRRQLLGAPLRTVAEEAWRADLVVPQTVEPPRPQQAKKPNPFAAAAVTPPRERRGASRTAVSNVPARSASTDDAAFPRRRRRRQLLDRFTPQNYHMAGCTG